MTEKAPTSSQRRLHHVALGSGDVERLATFYSRTFGLAELRRFLTAEGLLRSIWLDLGGVILMIEHTGEPPRRVDGVGAGPFLLAFQVSPRERWQIESALERAGVTIESRTAFTSYARDPDHNRFAFSHHPDPGVPR